MQHLWMLKSHNKKNLLVFFSIFFQFIEKNFHFLNQKFNIFFFFKIIRFFSIQPFLNAFALNQFKLTMKKKEFFHNLTETFTDVQITKRTLYKNIIINKESRYSLKHNLFLNNDKKFYRRLLDFFFLNSFLPYNSFFPQTGFFSLFFFKNSQGSPYVINLNKVMARWIDYFNLILNVYSIDETPLIYSSPFFKDETLALNWNLNIWDVRSWKYTYPYFIFKTNYFSQQTSFFYEKLKELQFDLLIVSDCLYHYKNLYFFKKNHYYTIGLVSLNVNPWIVSYPVLASSNSYINQIFFLQSLVYSQKKTLQIKFIFFKKLWNYAIFSKFTILNGLK